LDRLAFNGITCSQYTVYLHCKYTHIRESASRQTCLWPINSLSQVLYQRMQATMVVQQIWWLLIGLLSSCLSLGPTQYISYEVIVSHRARRQAGRHASRHTDRQTGAYSLIVSIICIADDTHTGFYQVVREQNTAPHS